MIDFKIYPHGYLVFDANTGRPLYWTPHRRPLYLFRLDLFKLVAMRERIRHRSGRYKPTK